MKSAIEMDFMISTSDEDGDSNINEYVYGLR